MRNLPILSNRQRTCQALSCAAHAILASRFEGRSTERSETPRQEACRSNACGRVRATADFGETLALQSLNGPATRALTPGWPRRPRPTSGQSLEPFRRPLQDASPCGEPVELYETRRADCQADQPDADLTARANRRRPSAAHFPGRSGPGRSRSAARCASYDAIFSDVTSIIFLPSFSLTSPVTSTVWVDVRHQLRVLVRRVSPVIV